MQDDPIVAEIRQIREEIAARFNYDIEALGKYARDRDAACGQKVISLPPRPPELMAAKPRQSQDVISQ